MKLFIRYYFTLFLEAFSTNILKEAAARNHFLRNKAIAGRVLLAASGFFLTQGQLFGQEIEICPISDISSVAIVEENETASPEEPEKANFATIETKTDIIKEVSEENDQKKASEIKPFREIFLKPEAQAIIGKKEPIPKTLPDDPPTGTSDADKQNGKARFHWKPAIAESIYFLGIEHGFRLVQKKTRREFKGPFFKDWARSVKNLNGWRDGDSLFVNYVAHPMQGAVLGRIFVNNSDKAKRLTFDNSKGYWESRMKAMAWSAAWNTQFEIGLISEASIGNVGLYDRVGPNRMGWVDMVVTPTAGTGVLIGEDMIDKYVLQNWLEKKLKSRTRIKIYRTFFTPFQSFANFLAGKAPWRRDNR